MNLVHFLSVFPITTSWLIKAQEENDMGPGRV